MPLCQPAIITFTERFVQALTALCDESPSLAMCQAWLNAEGEELQSWVLNHMKCEWATGIGTIDAAMLLAEQVEEGRPELVTIGIERVIARLKAGPLHARRTQSKGWVAHPQSADLDVQVAVSTNIAVVAETVGNTATLHLSDQFMFDHLQT